MKDSYKPFAISSILAAVVVGSGAFLGSILQRTEEHKFQESRNYKTIPEGFSRLDGQQAEHLAKQNGLRYAPRDIETLKRLAKKEWGESR